MKKILSTISLTLLFVSIGFAQSDDYNKAEVFLGYSINRVDFGTSGDADVDRALNSKRNFHGFNGSVTGNVNKYVGLKFDASVNFRDFNTTIPGFTNQPQIKASIQNYLGGVQVKNNSKDRVVKPFAHALVGLGRVKSQLNDSFCREALGTNCPAEFRDSTNALAMAFGGGIDVKVGSRVSLRLVQVDYNPMRKNGETINNVRFGFGIVFH